MPEWGCLISATAIEEKLMRRWKILHAITVLTVCLLLAATTFAASEKIKPGDIPGIDAGELLKRVSKEKGKVMVVNVFASWCPPCRDEIPGLVRARRDFTEEQVALLGVSVDKEPKALANYINELRINYPIMLAEGDFIQRVKVTAVPQLLIYNKKGELVVNHRGLVDEADLKKTIADLLME